MAWFDLLIAGLFEVVWSTCLKYSHGFTNLKFTLLTFAGMAASFWFLAHAIKALPMGHGLCHLDGHRRIGRCYSRHCAV